MDKYKEAMKVLKRQRVKVLHLTLQQVEDTSEGKWKKGAIGTYERGQRVIPMDKFLELCEFYSLEPSLVLDR